MNGNDFASYFASVIAGLLIGALVIGALVGGAVVATWNYFGG